MSLWQHYALQAAAIAAVASSQSASDCYNQKAVAYVTSDTTANVEFWLKRCKLISPGGDIHQEVHQIMIEMGDLLDFYMPADGYNWCDMLVARDRHYHSTDGTVFYQPDYYVPSSSSFGPLGGSAAMPDTGTQSRGYLTFWGSESYAGGCCQSQDSTHTQNTWRQPFTVYSCSRCKEFSASPAGGESLGRVHWANACQNIPSSATMIRVTVGAVVDYFQPVQGSSLCEMLQANNKHQWSPDGTNWQTPNYSFSSSALGGSAKDWPSNGADGDTRQYLSFWGSDNAAQAGACCTSTLQQTGFCNSDACDPPFQDGPNYGMKIEYCRAELTMDSNSPWDDFAAKAAKGSAPKR